MFQTAHTNPDSEGEYAIDQPAIVRGADDQVRAYEEWMDQWAAIDPEEEEHEWEMLKDSLQETRRALGYRLPFPEGTV